jgi:hypothetical protein
MLGADQDALTAHDIASEAMWADRYRDSDRGGAFAYNLGNFMRSPAMPEAAEAWSLTSLREKLIKIGARVVSYVRYVTFQMAEVAVSRRMHGAGKLFREVASAAKTDRAQLRRVIDQLDAGDVLLVTRLDRLARSTRDLLNTLAAIGLHPVASLDRDQRRSAHPTTQSYPQPVSRRCNP